VWSPRWNPDPAPSVPVVEEATVGSMLLTERYAQLVDDAVCVGGPVVAALERSLADGEVHLEAAVVHRDNPFGSPVFEVRVAAGSLTASVCFVDGLFDGGFACGEYGLLESFEAPGVFDNLATHAVEWLYRQPCAL
jgi:hypothetical protein